ncbi:WXG100 family type VII secretion target [Streptomyces sp. NPDC092296]|uniref:WXG100 family type VII secretion target n=1 Tax=Streptomyces sp. NPDC092296 TaxID=3366012 RepID=UPI003801F591
MTQGTFRVEADELGQVSRELGEATGSMGGAMQALHKADPKVTGHLALDSACAGFSDHWKYGLKQLNEALRAIGDGLDATVRSYRQTDDAIRGTMTGQVSA